MAGEWAYSTEHAQPCRVLETEALWGRSTSLVWLPQAGTVVRTPSERLVPLGECPGETGHDVVFACAAARISDALARDTLVAPLEGSLIPLPHQITALQRVMGGDRVRFLLADEVGLGKTIEAGLVLRELKARGLVRRTLIVAPAGLVTQWQAEMRGRFGEEFRLVLPSGFETWRAAAGLDERENLWSIHDQVICSLDSVKPVEARRGWSAERVARHNRERFDDLVSGGWDLVVFDEAHRLAGSTSEVARYRLADAVAEVCPYLLLLSATPHQGKSDAFRRLIGLLDPEALPDESSVRRELVAPYVIRTEKRRAIDADGQPLFKPRVTQIVPVGWGDDRQDEKALYDAVTEYVREGYNQAVREKRTAVGFLMILMQRLLTSSTAAIRTALERRRDVLKEEAQPRQPESVGGDPSDDDGQDAMEELLSLRLAGFAREQAEVDLLLAAARRSEARGPDAKAEALLDWIRRLQVEENDPELKVLVFTEFVPTQEMLARYLGERGFKVACLNGSMSMEERQRVQAAFAGDARVLVSTDAGGEGLNLQFCHVVVNYDLPWNPMKLEQRIGRVDRIGQAHVVRAFNFALQDTVELRVREVLEAKLRVILEEFGVDKLADVLDSEEGAVDFEGLYIGAVLTPAETEKRAAALADDIRRRIEAARQGESLLGSPVVPDPAVARGLAEHPMAFWVERMTVSWLRSRRHEGAGVARDDPGVRLRWPDGGEIRHAVFTAAEARDGRAVHVTLDEPKVRRLLRLLAHAAPGAPVSVFVLPGISDKVQGTWSLWRIGLESADGGTYRFLPVFAADDDRVLPPTARTVWDRLIDAADSLPHAVGRLVGEAAATAYVAARRAAEHAGADIFTELLERHRQRLARERTKGQRSIAARRAAIGRLGLASVRAYRLARLDEEEREWAAALTARERGVPNLTPICVLRLDREVPA